MHEVSICLYTLQVILAAVLSVAVAAPAHSEPAPAPAGYGYAPPVEVVKIVKDDRSQGYDGRYTVEVAAENGISLAASGTPTGPDGAIVASGHYS